jgi:hypothetical protein
MKVIEVEGFGSKGGYYKEYPYSKKLYKLLTAKCPNETWVSLKNKFKEVV